MTLEEAIEINEENKEYFEKEGFLVCADAVRLGNEALKREEQRRSLELTGIKVLLPGETDD